MEIRGLHFYHLIMFRVRDQKENWLEGIKVMEDFPLNHEVYKNGPSDPTASVMTAEIFRPIEENDISQISSEEDVNFRSYFSIDGMLMTRITDQFDEQSQVKFWELAEHIQQHNFSQSSPYFVEYKCSHSGATYVEMSVGVR